MAGVKITDLSPLLTTPVDGDLFYIVDISDTTESPEGTSKKIEFGNLFESGIWIPTFSGATGALSSPTILLAYYSRVGSIVSCTINGSVTFDFSSLLSGTFATTLPIIGTNSIGIANFGDYENGATGFILDDIITLKAITTDALNQTVQFYVTFQYEIV